MRTWLDLVLLTWFFTAAMRASIVGTPKEIEFIANKLHGFYSNPSGIGGMLKMLKETFSSDFGWVGSSG